MITRTGMRQVKKPEDVPEGRHFAVIIYNTTSVHVPGDERSRTNPGHGYPEHTDTYDTFQHWVTQDRETLAAFILEIENERKRRLSYIGFDPYVVLNVERKGTISHQTNVEV